MVMMMATLFSVNVYAMDPQKIMIAANEEKMKREEINTVLYLKDRLKDTEEKKQVLKKRKPG